MEAIARAVPIISVLLIYYARIAELRTPRDIVRGHIRENLTLRAFIAVGSLMLVGSTVEYLWRRPALHVSLVAAGWGCALLSFWVRRRAIRELGKMWSLHVEIREQHELIVSGPYRWVRHPAYCSMVLELVSFGLLLESRFTSLLVALLFAPTLIVRIRLEEAALRTQLSGYADYQRTTPALFPYKLPRAVQP